MSVSRYVKLKVHIGSCHGCLLVTCNSERLLSHDPLNCSLLLLAIANCKVESLLFDSCSNRICINIFISASARWKTKIPGFMF